MIFFTHILGGILAVAYFGSFFSIDSSGSVEIVAMAVAALFAVLPDLDTVKSKAGRNLQPFSTVFAFFFRHRGFLHSIPATALIYLAMRYLSTQAIAAAAAIGYVSHLFLDSMTKEGITPFSPLSKWKVRGFIRTGSVFEKVILASLAVMLLLRLA